MELENNDYKHLGCVSMYAIKVIPAIRTIKPKVPTQFIVSIITLSSLQFYLNTDNAECQSFEILLFRPTQVSPSKLFSTK